MGCLDISRGMGVPALAEMERLELWEGLVDVLTAALGHTGFGKWTLRLFLQPANGCDEVIQKKVLKWELGKLCKRGLILWVFFTVICLLQI